MGCNDKNKEWLSSKEVIKTTKLKDCELMHYRLKGIIKFEKKGNAYFYKKESIEELIKPNSK